MKGTITVEFNAKEALSLLAATDLPKSVVNKVVTAFRTSNITPQGAKAAQLSKVTKRSVRKAAITTEATASH